MRTVQREEGGRSKHQDAWPDEGKSYWDFLAEEEIVARQLSHFAPKEKALVVKYVYF